MVWIFDNFTCLKYMSAILRISDQSSQHNSYNTKMYHRKSSHGTDYIYIYSHGKAMHKQNNAVPATI